MKDYEEVFSGSVVMISWKDELPDSLIRDGSSDTMSFTLDSSGEWEESKSYATVGTTVKVSGTIISPDGTWNVQVSSSQGWKKEYDSVPTGQSESFSIKTNFGSTKVTIKIWSVNGSADEGLQGQFKITY
tara:strand:+ start:201 stop:590 length:390 start_codon:yes stop_codon:yes gene_type:complete